MFEFKQLSVIRIELTLFFIYHQTHQLVGYCSVARLIQLYMGELKSLICEYMKVLPYTETQKSKVENKLITPWLRKNRPNDK